MNEQSRSGYRGPTVASERDVTKALLDVGFTVVGLSPRIQQSDFDHPNFIALPAALTNLDAGKDVTGAAIPVYGAGLWRTEVTLS